MELLDWIFIGALASSILFGIFSLLFLFLIGSVSGQRKQMIARQTTSKKKQAIRRKIRKLEKRRRSYWFYVVFSFIFAMGLSSVALYSRYYQATNLGATDSEGIVQGYYLLSEVGEQIEEIEEKDPEKTINNLRELAAKLSGFGMRGVDSRLSEEGQQLLSRYYNQVKELGLNLNNQSYEMTEDPELQKEYVEKINTIKATQKKVLIYFKVNESALKQKK